MLYLDRQRGIFQKLSFILGMTWEGFSKMFETELTNDSAKQMITDITHVMNVNIMPNILATWKGTKWLNSKFLWSMLVIPIMMRIIRR